jgi:hypothetical protein
MSHRRIAANKKLIFIGWQIRLLPISEIPRKVLTFHQIFPAPISFEGDEIMFKMSKVMKYAAARGKVPQDRERGLRAMGWRNPMS